LGCEGFKDQRSQICITDEKLNLEPRQKKCETHPDPHLLFSIRNNEKSNRMLWKSSRFFYEERPIRLELLKHLDNTGMPFRVSDPRNFYVDPDPAFTLMRIRIQLPLKVKGICDPRALF
jgi:hypothetical protein